VTDSKTDIKLLIQWASGSLLLINKYFFQRKLEWFDCVQSVSLSMQYNKDAELDLPSARKYMFCLMEVGLTVRKTELLS
jgi:hypothetical protein